MRDRFRRFAHRASAVVGTPWSFGVAVLLIVVWGVTGPLFHFSDTWQLVINTGTTIITFLMVFLIQNTQNRDSQAVHLKLDELLRAVKEARTELVDLESLSDDDLTRLRAQFQRLREHYAERFGDPIARIEAELSERRASTPPPPPPPSQRAAAGGGTGTSRS